MAAPGWGAGRAGPGKLVWGDGVKGWLDPPSLTAPPHHLCSCTFQSRISSPSPRTLTLESAPPLPNFHPRWGAPVRREEGLGPRAPASTCPPGSRALRKSLPPLRPLATLSGSSRAPGLKQLIFQYGSPSAALQISISITEPLASLSISLTQLFFFSFPSSPFLPLPSPPL